MKIYKKNISKNGEIIKVKVKLNIEELIKLKNPKKWKRWLWNKIQ